MGINCADVTGMNFMSGWNQRMATETVSPVPIVMKFEITDVPQGMVVGMPFVIIYWRKAGLHNQGRRE